MNLKNCCLLVALSLMLSFLGSCSKTTNNDTCLSFQKAPVTKVEGANIALVNQEITLTVSFQCMNGCGQFESFNEVIAGNTSTISVTAKYEGCICTQDLPTRQVAWKFKRSQPGIYTLKFLQTNDTYISHTVLVQ